MVGVLLNKKGALSLYVPKTQVKDAARRYIDWPTLCSRFYTINRMACSQFATINYNRCELLACTAPKTIETPSELAEPVIYSILKEGLRATAGLSMIEVLR